MTRTPALFIVLLLAGVTLVSTGRTAPARPEQPAVDLPLLFAPVPDRSGATQFVGRGGGRQLVISPITAVLAAGPGKAVRLQFPGADPSAVLTGEQPQATRVSYLLGRDPSRWRSGLPTFGAVRVREAYPGIDLVYYTGNRELEYDIVVKPGADTSRIALRFEGDPRATVTPEGSLNLTAVRVGRPVTYQEVNGKRQPVASRFVAAGDEVRIALGSYDAQRPLIIDPTVSFSTLLGGTAEDYGLAIATDAQGRTYVAGRTTSLDFATDNATQPVFGGGITDAFIARLSANGRTLQTATYFGGLGEESINDLAIDDQGDVYLTGATNSEDFPLRNPIQGRFQGGISDGFMVKLDAELERLEYGTYLGGAGQDVGEGLAIGPSHTAYVTGKTGSIDFPTTPGSFQRRLAGGTTDAFVARLAEDGESLRYATYLGDLGEENFGLAAGRIAVDSDGNAYVTGTTTSPRFPTTPLAFQRVMRGGQDVYLTKLDNVGETLLYSTLLGGGSRDFAGDVAVTAEGSAIVIGSTESVNFPVTRGALQQRFGGGTWDAFVTRFLPSGQEVEFSTYLGGRGDEGATLGSATDFGAVALRQNGEIVVAGRTDSFNFPVTSAVQPRRGGFTDGFFSRLSEDGERLLESTYLGGGADDAATDLAVDANGDVSITGFTASRDFPLADPVQSIYAGGFYDAWVLRIDEPAPPAPKPQLRFSANHLDFGNVRVGKERVRSLTLRNAGKTSVSVSVGSVSAPFEIVEGGGDFTLARGKSRRLRVQFTPTIPERSRQELAITSSDPVRPSQTIALVGKGLTSTARR